MVNQVLMRETTDCEIPAIANACGLTYEEVATVHDEINGDFRDDLNGSPWHVRETLRRLGKGSEIIPLGVILNGSVDASKVILLVHIPESPILSQHWVNVGKQFDIRVELLWNTPADPVKIVTYRTLYELYSAGVPACALLVTNTPEDLPWYQRLWVWLTRLLF